MKKLKKVAVILSGVLILTGLSANTSSAIWFEENGKWWNTNGSEIGYSTGWEQIAGKWYFFDSNGWMLTGWQKDINTWYYLNNTGEMLTGWIDVDGKGNWYYLEQSGAMRTEDLTQGNKRYCFDSNGKCTNPAGETLPSTATSSIPNFTSWVSYSTGSPAELARNILKGNVVYYNGQYWASPEYANMLANEVIVYQNDISNEPLRDRFSFSEIDLSGLSKTNSNIDLDGYSN